MICEIIPDKRTSPNRDTFSYLVPENLQNQISIGSIVKIPFGKKIVQGVVVNIVSHHFELAFDSTHAPSSTLRDKPSGSDSNESAVERDPESRKLELDSYEGKNDRGERKNDNEIDNDGANYQLKQIKSINSDFLISKEYIEIAKWISKYYLCSLGEAISLFLPPNVIRPRLTKKININNHESNRKVTLTNEQKVVFEKLRKKINYGGKALLFGVTGSGKTEIYLKLAEQTLKNDKQIIVLVPEIMLTPQIVEQFEKTFPNQICLMHSGLSNSEKFNSYQDFYSGKKSIIIGPRSALLVPSQNLGLIIIDEEQEDAYKQEKNPRYHAVSLAEKIAEKLNALLVVGTATPRVETYYRCRPGLVSGSQKSDGIPKQIRHDDTNSLTQSLLKNKRSYDLYELKSRYQKLILPPSEIVDLKDEIKRDNYSPISIKLQKKIAEVLKAKRQIILFLNRRGISTFVACRECGQVINCKNCNIPMVYHIDSGQNILNCHHCNFSMPVPIHCPNCHGLKIKYFGAGIDKIESEIKKLFPGAKVRKIDSKSLANKNEYFKLHDDLKNKKIDILIGTQILAKGLNIPTVDLVGIISADTGLHLPHFLAEEKVFSLLTQVSGRSGRSDNVGQTIIQSYWPNSSAIELAAKHDYHTFYEKEILEREKYNYPPFCHLVRIISENHNENIAKKEIEKIATELKKEKFNFIGPAKCFLSKINNKYRYHILIKTDHLPDSKITSIFSKNPYLTWDIDPIDLL